LARSRPQPDRSGNRSVSDGTNRNLPAANRRWFSRLKRAIATVVAALLVGFGATSWSLVFPRLSGTSSIGGQAEAATPATFVGSEICAGCHQAEAKLWRDSQHKHAMDHATEKSVLGNFNDTSFDYYGVHSRFFRKDGHFFVETDGPDGKLATFEVKYTFGVYPLQQYLIEFPDGRIQALSIAWDSRPKEQGGQRWFHLYPNENIRYDDILHWTKLNQNWNFMCSECHSTGLRRNYDAAKDRYATTWTEISVGCEACHGRGSNHVAWARSQQNWLSFNRSKAPTKGMLATFDDRNGVVWSRDPRSGKVQRNLPPNVLRKEVETCGRCHARRSEISENWIPGQWLQQTHAIATPLGRDVYWADGQIRDVQEPYNYVPFKQSKMFAAGVTCSDCHNPHSGKLRFSGSGVCLQCHAAKTYASAKHSHHAQANGKPNCTSCHMPARMYMVIDPRHDHSMRIPRPDLSVKLGTPNACNYCHTDKPAQWAADAVKRWFGPNREGFQNYAEAFHAAWTDKVDAEKLLAAVAANGSAPNVARASALIELAPFISPANADLARRGLSDPDPMIRIAAMDMLVNVPPAQIWSLASPLLSDPVRGVRIRAVNLLAAVPTDRQPQADRKHFDSAAAELVVALRLSADRPEDRSSLANFYAKRGLTSEAEAEYKAALRLSPQFAPAAVNLADLYRRLGRDSDGESALRKAIIISPAVASLHYSLGLTFTRMKKPEDAIREFRRAYELEPNSARYSYVYAVALHSAGQRDEAMAVLKKTLAAHPNDRDTLLALIAYSRDSGDISGALAYANQLAQIGLEDSNLKTLVETLKRQIKKTNAN
jgi:predicted CXXCH cytochrome family protein